MSLAWSTAAVLLGLLPGFAFLAGLAAAEPYSRDNTPKSPLAQLALILFLSVLVHAALIATSAGVAFVPSADPPGMLSAMLADDAESAAAAGAQRHRGPARRATRGGRIAPVAGRGQTALGKDRD